jgi:hypothetical protein
LLGLDHARLQGNPMDCIAHIDRYTSTRLGVHRHGGMRDRHLTRQNIVVYESARQTRAPDVDCYIILHANKSTVITATNQQRLDAAVKRFIGSSRQRNGKREAPFGLATSFELGR